MLEGSGAASRFRLLGLELGHTLLHRGLIQPIFDRPDQACDLALHDLEPALVRGPGLHLLGSEAIELFLKHAGEHLDLLGLQQPMLQALEHAVLQILPPYPVPVAAGALGAVRSAP
jgi:hypothetical protein